MDEPLTFKDEQGHRISAVLSRPSQPSTAAVVLCHGFLSSKNSTTNKTLTRMVNEAGLATFRFDFFGQGDSEGPFEDIRSHWRSDRPMRRWLSSTRRVTEESALWDRALGAWWPS